VRGNHLTESQFHFLLIFRILSKANALPPGYAGPERGTPYNGLYGEAPPESGTFLRLQVHESVGISLVEVYEVYEVYGEVYER